jgi:hypothetical protein
VTYVLSPAFIALLKEGQFTREMLGAGATQIRKANYATKGIYFQAFTSLSTGIERIGKLCLALDFCIAHGGKFPDFSYMKDEIGHKISLIYEKSKAIIAKRSLPMAFLRDLDDPIHLAILKVLSEFANGDRYSNIDLLVGARRQGDPVAAWCNQVDRPIFESRVTARKKETIRHNASIVGVMLQPLALTRHSSESGDAITDAEDASYRTGMFQAVAPYRQLYVLQVIRYWADLIRLLQGPARGAGNQDIPFLDEVFAPFYNPDSYLRQRKIW